MKIIVIMITIMITLILLIIIIIIAITTPFLFPPTPGTHNIFIGNKNYHHLLLIMMITPINLAFLMALEKDQGNPMKETIGFW